MTRQAAIAKAAALGHQLEDDPLALSGYERLTCSECGRAVLVVSRHAYGSATEQACTRVPAEPT